MSQAVDFMNEMNSLKDARLPISKIKVKELSSLAIENDKQYKFVIFHIEKFLKNCPNDKILPAIYVMDSIMRKAQSTYDTKNDVFTLRFIKSLPKILPQLLCAPAADKDKIIKVFGHWDQKEFFTKHICMLCIDYLTEKSDSKLSMISSEVELYLSKIDIVSIYNKTITSRKHNSSKSVVDTSNDIALSFLAPNDGSKLEKPFLELLDALDNIFKILESQNNPDLIIASNLLETSFSNFDSQAMDYFSHGHTNFLDEKYTERTNDIYQSLLKHISEFTQNKESISFNHDKPNELFNFFESANKSSKAHEISMQNNHDMQAALALKDSPEFALYIKKKYVTIFSDTVWVGKIPKVLTESELHTEIYKFGQVLEFNMISNRGCAYVKMNRRTDANLLKDHFDNFRISKANSGIKTSWALPNEFRDKYKSFWVAETGIILIPWSHFKQSELDFLVRYKALLLHFTLPPNFHKQISNSEWNLDSGIHEEFIDLNRSNKSCILTPSSEIASSKSSFTPKKNEWNDSSYDSRKSKSPRDSRKSKNKYYDSPSKKENKKHSDFSNYHSSNRVSPPKHSSSRGNHRSSSKNRNSYSSNHGSSYRYTSSYSNRGHYSPNKQRSSNKYSDCNSSYKGFNRSPVWDDEKEDTPTSKQSKIDNSKIKNIDNLVSLSPYNSTNTQSSLNSNRRFSISDTPLRIVNPSNPADSNYQTSFSDDHSSKMTTSDLMIGKLLQGYMTKKNMSKANQNRPLDLIKANIFNPGSNAGKNIDFKNHEEFAKFVFDNNALNEALSNQFGQIFPNQLSDEQTNALINNIPTFINRLGSPDQLNFSIGENTMPTQSKPQNDLNILPPPPPPKP